jgi:hypothetical protein
MAAEGRRCARGAESERGASPDQVNHVTGRHCTPPISRSDKMDRQENRSHPKDMAQVQGYRQTGSSQGQGEHSRHLYHDTRDTWRENARQAGTSPPRPPSRARERGAREGRVQQVSVQDRGTRERELHGRTCDGRDRDSPQQQYCTGHKDRHQSPDSAAPRSRSARAERRPAEPRKDASASRGTLGNQDADGRRRPSEASERHRRAAPGSPHLHRGPPQTSGRRDVSPGRGRSDRGSSHDHQKSRAVRRRSPEGPRSRSGHRVYERHREHGSTLRGDSTSDQGRVRLDGAEGRYSRLARCRLLDRSGACTQARGL